MKQVRDDPVKSIIRSRLGSLITRQVYKMRQAKIKPLIEIWTKVFHDQAKTGLETYTPLTKLSLNRASGPMGVGGDPR